MKRRDFMKLIGVAMVFPTALVKAEPLVKTSTYFTGGIVNAEKLKTIILKITAQKYLPEIYGFHFEVEAQTFEDYKERFDRAREYFKRKQSILEFEVDSKGIDCCMVIGDRFSFEHPDKSMCGEYRIIKIEERPKRKNESET